MFGVTNNLENHSLYTTKEWNSSEYYIKVLGYLKDRKIKTFVDIGSCSGVLSKLFFERIPSLEKCVLVEPVSDNYNFIVNNVSNNEDVFVYNRSLYYGKDVIHIGQVDGNVGAFSILSNLGSIESKTSTLEEINENPFWGGRKIDFVKIDIEGAEYNFIENSTLLKEIPYIEIEFHNNVEYGVLEGSERYNIWKPFIEKNLPNHELIYGGLGKYKWPNGQEVVYDGSGFFKLKKIN